jgi:hypothetical protein
VKKYRYPLAVVTWLDACFWEDNDDGTPHHAPMKQVTAGWLLQRDAAGVSLAFELNGDEDEPGHRGEQFIPAGMVVKVEVIRE